MPPLNSFSRSALALAISSALISPIAQAVEIEVTSNLDDGTGCTLREAIASANTSIALENGCALGSGGTDTITFSNTVLAASPSNTITLTQGELRITEGRDISINASNIDGGITVDADNGDADNGSRVLYVNSATLSIDSLTITGGAASDGGGIYANNSSVSLSNSTVSGNSASDEGGGIYAKSSSVSLSNSTVSGNSASDEGGGIFANNSSSVSLNNSTVSDNSATWGGGIYARSSSVSLSNSTVSGNSVSYEGGGIYAKSSNSVSLNNSTVSGNSAQWGGGIYVRDSSVVLSNSTVSGNSASTEGGGIYADKSDSGNSSTISLSNSTVSGNSAGDRGGGIYANNSSSVILSNSTVSGNSANEGGGIYAINSSSVSLSNSIIANSSGGDDVHLLDSSTLNSDSASIIEEASFGGSRTGDPDLLPLTNNGGATKTHALRSNSIARDQGILTGAAVGFEDCTTHDQREQLRDDGDGACDVGAIEFNSNDNSNFYVIPLPNGKTAVIPL